MRKVKFRAWLDDDKKMFNNAGVVGKVVVLEHNGEGDIDDNTDFEPMYWGSVDDSTIHVMQFTGLKDKNGKEIYEGDILQYDSPSLQHQYKHQVIFNDGSYRFSGMDSFVFSEMNLNYKRGYKVIGNIYENPELINS